MIIYPRHPVIPPEVWGFRYMFLGWPWMSRDRSHKSVALWHALGKTSHGGFSFTWLGNSTLRNWYNRNIRCFHITDDVLRAVCTCLFDCYLFRQKCTIWPSWILTLLKPKSRKGFPWRSSLLSRSSISMISIVAGLKYLPEVMFWKGAILSYSYVLVVHLYDSVPWTFISSSKVTSSLEDLQYVMWTREV